MRHNPAASFDFGADAADQLLHDGYMEGGGEDFVLEEETANLGYTRTMDAELGIPQVQFHTAQSTFLEEIEVDGIFLSLWRRADGTEEYQELPF